MPYPEKKANAGGGGKDPNEIGALWEKQSKSGGVYYTGEIAGQRVVVFPVNKKHDRSPALRVLKSSAVPGGEAKSVTRQAPVTDDDIPF